MKDVYACMVDWLGPCQLLLCSKLLWLRGVALLRGLYVNWRYSKFPNLSCFAIAMAQ